MNSKEPDQPPMTSLNQMTTYKKINGTKKITWQRNWKEKKITTCNHNWGQIVSQGY